MRVLVACEFSGIVRDAFLAKWHDAVSCDLLPSEREGPHHCGPVEFILKDGWDLMIAHPPCTHLAVSGARYFMDKVQQQEDALAFVWRLMSAPIEKIALENPVGIISTRIRKPDQIIQPYEFGEDASKKTCLWLKNLPRLVPTMIVPPNEKGVWSNQTPSGQNKLGPSPTRAQDRSRTYQGIANAMAEQWGSSE